MENDFKMPAFFSKFMNVAFSLKTYLDFGFFISRYYHEEGQYSYIRYLS